jgi:protein-disulfide isomerase
LQTNPVFNYAAQNLLLEDPNGVVFINIPSLMETLPALVEVAPVSDLQEIAVIGAVVESITMSSSINDDVSRVRLTLTVPQQPNVPQFTLAEPTVPLTQALPTRYDGLLQSLPAEGIAQLGPDNPAVTVQLFESFSCPHCANFDQAYMDELVNLVRNESVSLQYIPMLTGPVPNGDLATMGAYCAGEQDAFWPYHDLLFQWHREFGNEAFTVDRLESGVHDLGLDFDTFIACIESGRGVTFLSTGGQLANAAGVTGTPTIFVNGERISQDMMIAAIEDALP